MVTTTKKFVPKSQEMFLFGLEMPHLQPTDLSCSREAAVLKRWSTRFTMGERGEMRQGGKSKAQYLRLTASELSPCQKRYLRWEGRRFTPSKSTRTNMYLLQ